MTLSTKVNRRERLPQIFLPDDAPSLRQRMNSKKYFYGLLPICERGITGLGHIN
jgi:hypothetical protein